MFEGPTRHKRGNTNCHLAPDEGKATTVTLAMLSAELKATTHNNKNDERGSGTHNQRQPHTAAASEHTQTHTHRLSVVAHLLVPDYGLVGRRHTGRNNGRLQLPLRAF